MQYRERGGDLGYARGNAHRHSQDIVNQQRCPRNLCSDFLYQLEWLRYRKEGLLTALDVAFSRDQASKLYVQHRLLENSAQIYAWLQRGAHFYVCGDAKKMAGDVHEALLTIIRQEGGLSNDNAAAYITDLKQARRYQRDVY